MGQAAASSSHRAEEDQDRPTNEANNGDVAAAPIEEDEELQHEVDVEEAQRWVVCRKANPKAKIRSAHKEAVREGRSRRGGDTWLLRSCDHRPGLTGRSSSSLLGD